MRRHGGSLAELHGALVFLQGGDRYSAAVAGEPGHLD
jgi:hypothetical protein